MSSFTDVTDREGLTCSAPDNGFKRLNLANRIPYSIYNEELGGKLYAEERELLDQYKAHVRNDRRRILKGRAAEASFVTLVDKNDLNWTESVYNRIKALEMRGLSTQPFIEMLNLPPNQRPTTLIECIDFFYPESGFTSVDKTISPFVGTGIWNYILGHDSNGNPIANENIGGNVPLQLGEITMMYGWFLVYRLLLCPNRFAGVDIPATNIFSRLPEERIRNVGVVSAAERELKEDIRKLNQISKVVDILKSGAIAYANSEIVLESTDDFIDFAQELLTEDTIREFAVAGVNKITSYIAKSIGFPEELANDVAVMLVEGAMDPDKWASLKQFEGINFDSVSNLYEKAKARAYEVTTGYFNTKFDDLFKVSNLSNFEVGQYANMLYDFFATAVVTPELFRNIDRIPDEDLKRQIFEYVTVVSSRESQKFRDTYLEYGVRENPGVVLAISAAAALIKGGISYAQRVDQSNFNELKRYYTENIFVLPEVLTVDAPFSFEFSNHIRKGLIEEGYWAWEDDEFTVKPTCELQQGGQMLEYWTHVFKSFRPILNTIRSAYRSGQGTFDFWESSFSTDSYLRNPVSYSFDFDRGNRKCAGLWWLAENCMKSTKKVFENLDIFSPFTHQYGFAPIMKMEGTLLRLDGRAARTFLGPDNTVPTTPDSPRGASAAPNRTNYFRNDEPHFNRAAQSSWRMGEVECYLQSKPLPSRRRLEGKYGGRASVSFDVAFDDVPVMDAQFCALMSVLFVYPEAITALRQSSIPWSKELPIDTKYIQVISSLYANRVFSPVNPLINFFNHNYINNILLPQKEWRVNFEALSKKSTTSSLASKLTKAVIVGGLVGGGWLLWKKKKGGKL